MEEKILEYVNPRDLKPYPWNTKEHPVEQVQLIAESIRRFGFRGSVVVDANNTILAGHGRVEAAIKLGLEAIPVERVDFGKAGNLAYHLADNKTSTDTGYNQHNVVLTLNTLADLGYDGMQDLRLEEFRPDGLDLGPPPPDDEGEEESGGWVGQITLKVPREEIEHFEADLDELIRRYDGIEKKVKKVK